MIGTGCILVLIGVQFSSMIQENQTVDEAAHLAAGWSYVSTGDFRMNPEHPALGKLISALPLTVLNPTVPTDDPSWQSENVFAFGRAFLYHNRYSPELLLTLGRLPTILLTVLCAVLLFIVSWRAFGIAAGVASLALFAFDPTVIAHGRYVTTDMIATLMIFASVVAWDKYLETGTPRSLLIASLCIGLAQTSKFSALILFPLIAVLYGICWWLSHRVNGWPRLSLTHACVSLAIVLSVSGLLIFAVHGFSFQLPINDRFVADAYLHPLTGNPNIPPFVAKLTDRTTNTGKLMYSFVSTVPIPAYPYVRGVFKFLGHNYGGHTAYLLGKFSNHGWWWYFPFAFLVKSPVGTLILTGGGFVLGLRWLFAHRHAQLYKRLQRIPLIWISAPVSIIMIMAAAMMSSLNLGIRHILPIFPFLFLLIGGTLFSDHHPRYIKSIGALLITLTIAESIAIFPNYLAFFNIAVGGPSSGPKYLTDSNLDWGQDVKKLKLFMKEQGLNYVCMVYFGQADLDWYNIDYRYLPTSDDTKGINSFDCVAVISVTALYGEGGTYRWLRDLTPSARIGYSLYVYDLRKE